MPDQAETLRGLVGSPKRFAKVLTFASGKGGVGKSNLALATAITLASRDLKVAIMDMDLGLANLDILMGVQPRFNLSHVMAGQKQLTEIIVPGPHDVMLIPGASGVSRLANLKPMERQELTQKFAEIESLVDLLIVDTGAGLGENIVHFALASSAIIVVTTPEPTARMDAYALIKTALARNPEMDVQILVNEVSGEREAQDVFEGLCKVCRQHLSSSPNYLGHVPKDENVPRSVAQRTSFVLHQPRCPAAKAVRAVASQIERHLFPSSEQLDNKQRTSFLTRLFSAFSGKSS